MARMPVIPQMPEPPPGLELSPVPNLEGIDAAAQWMRDRLGIPATARWIHDKTNAGQIRYALLMGRRFYSTRALYDFVMTQTKVGGKTADQ